MFGITADYDGAPDVDELANGIELAVARLEALTQVLLFGKRRPRRRGPCNGGAGSPGSIADHHTAHLDAGIALLPARQLLREHPLALGLHGREVDTRDVAELANLLLLQWFHCKKTRNDRVRPKSFRSGGGLSVPAQAWITLVVGVVGFTGLIAGIVQRTYADRQAEWWRRATWAVDHTLSEDVDAQMVGFDVLAKLQSSRLATRSDRDLFAQWATPVALGRDIDDEQANTVD